MRNRLIATFILTAAATAIAVPSGAYASRSCPSTSGYHVMVIRGSVSCGKARTVAKEWESSKGVTHPYRPTRFGTSRFRGAGIAARWTWAAWGASAVDSDR